METEAIDPDGQIKGELKEALARIRPWPIEFFEKFIERHEAYHKLMRVAIRSMSYVTRVPSMLETIDSALTEAALHGITEPGDRSKAKVEWEKIAGIADKEVRAGFPTLHGQMVVADWASL
jgi:hypothetical protein